MMVTNVNFKFNNFMCIVDFSTVIKLGLALCSLKKDSPLNKASKKELEAAENALSCLSSDSNIREGLNRVLGHLESAYAYYEPKTWDIFDNEDCILWDKRTYKNNLCIAISAIHMYLGNKHQAKYWLEHKLSKKGWISAYSLSLPVYNNAKDLFYAVYGENETYEELNSTITYNNNMAYKDEGDIFNNSFYP